MITTNNKVWMNSQHFLEFNIILIVVFALFYFISRKGGRKQPTVLNMYKGNDSSIFNNKLEKEAKKPETDKSQLNWHTIDAEIPPGKKVITYGKKRIVLEDDELVSIKNTKTLNIMFNYNGHSWDAYEVLGVPAGANITIVTRAYQEAIKGADPVKIDFLEQAYKSILKQV